MKSFFVFRNFITILFPLLCLDVNLQAQTHAGHPHLAKHQMILLGEAELIASHIVYKAPHNFQILMSLNLPPAVYELYRSERLNHPQDLMIFKLDPIDLATIRQQTQLIGSLIRQTETENVVLFENVILEQADFKILYFDELPLSLE